MDIYEKGTLEQLFVGLYPQLYGLFLAGVAFFLVRYFGEDFVGGTLGLRLLVIPLNLAIVGTISYFGHRLVRYTAEHEGQSESPWHVLFMAVPMLAVVIYVFFYSRNII